MALTKEYLSKRFIYKDGKLLWGLRSRIDRIMQPAGHVAADGYCRIEVAGTKVLAHRIIFCLHHGYMPDMVDHIDGNPRNNSIENLRACTNSSNLHNRGLQANNQSGVKNVSWIESSKLWHVQISKNGRRVISKYFTDLGDAAIAASTYRKEVHGEFASV